jgi:hypothetical protein
MSFYFPENDSYSALLKKLTSNNFPICSKNISTKYIYYNAYAFDKVTTDIEVSTKLLPMNKSLVIDATHDCDIYVLYVSCNYLHCTNTGSKITWTYDTSDTIN